MKRHLSIAATAMLAVVVAAGANAQPVDSFLTGGNASAGEYTVDTAVVGQNPTIAGWSGGWLEGCCGSLTVVGTGLAYPNLPTGGGALEAISLSGRVGRLLANPVTDSTASTVYMSFLSQVVGGQSGAQITYGGFELHDNGFGDGGDQRRLQLVAGENFGGGGQTPNYTVRLFGNSDPEFNVDLGANNGNVNLFVMKFELSDVDNADVFSVFRNPDLSTGVEPVTPDFTTTDFNMSFDRTSFARFGDAGTFTFDELRQGATYESVTAPVNPFIPGDTDGDFVVEFEDDFFPIRDHWLETNATFPGLARTDGDLNVDGKVDIVDFREWKNNFTGPPALISQALASLGSANVPEPGSMALLVGCCALASRVRSRKR